MIEYLIGVDGGGTGTRVRLARHDGSELATASGGPSGLALGIDAAWDAIGTAAAQAFASIGVPAIPLAACGIGLGLAGVHNEQWAARFKAANPGYAALLLATDAFTTLLGAHEGRPGSIVAIGTGSAGQALLADGSEREVGGWGFPSGDEASGGWIGLRAASHMQKVLDGRAADSPFARELIDACGGSRAAVQLWLGRANQTVYASLAPIVIRHAAGSDTAHAILVEAGREAAAIAHALDDSGRLPLALCGGLGAALRPFLPPALLARSVAPLGDSASGALRLIANHLKGQDRARPTQ